MELIPKRIQPYFEKTRQTKDGGNTLIQGILTCCNDHDFDVFVFGNIRQGVFSKMRLHPDHDRTVIEARCKKCGNVISVFDSDHDGYEQCGKNQHTHVPTRSIDCAKCKSGGFSVGIKFEYPDIQELKELEIAEIDNAFTWIWISLTCNNCKTTHRHFFDCETA